MIHADKFGHKIRDQFRRALIHPEKLSPELRSFAMFAGLAMMHPEKMSPALRELVDKHPEKIRHMSRMRAKDGDWLIVDSRFAEVYMAALAALLCKGD